MPTPPAPNLTFTVTPTGGVATDYTTRLAWAGAGSAPSISQHFGRQGDTANFTIVDDYGETGTTPIAIPVFSRVKLVDNAIGETLFAGVATDPVLDPVSPTRNEWNLQCNDFAFYADAAIVHGVYYGMTVDQIIIDLTRQANCGVLADTVANGGFVAPGPQLASFSLNYTTLTSAWRKLAILAGNTIPFGWYVDENFQLHFYDSTYAQNSGVTFTTTPTTDGSVTEGHLTRDGFSYEWDGTAIRNRILVQGATQNIYFGNSNTKPPTDTWRGNGVQNSWPLRYTVIGSPVVKVNGTRVDSELIQAGSAATTTAQWQIIQNSIGAWSLTKTGTPPGDGVNIKIWYSYQVPVVAQANDYQSQATYPGPNNGIFAAFIYDRSLTTVPMALNRAMRERTEYAYAVERITFTSSEDWVGWVRAGEVCQIVNGFVPDSTSGNVLGINDQFLVVANSVAFSNGGYRQSQITAVRLFAGPSSGYGSGGYGSGPFGG